MTSESIIVLLRLVLAVPGLVMNGYALSVLWRWFVVSAFGLPPLEISSALGLALVVQYMTYHPDFEREATKKGRNVALAFMILKAPTALAVGWVIKGFM